LPFPAALVASTSDPYMDIPAARSLARRWGAVFVNAGDCGHINVDSGHGPWPEGRELLTSFMSQVS
jgi:predicted alpha/beta hydrolase family esterase